MSFFKNMSKITTFLFLCFMIQASFFRIIISSDIFPGNPPICPRWALEPWVWEDNGNSRPAVEDLVNNYLSRNIPVGAVIIDSPWETYDNTFVWNQNEYHYPNAQEMIDNFHALGIKIILWITGFINTNSPDYSYVKSKGYTVNGGQAFNWWKGEGVHLDFTNSAARNWWHSKMDNVLNMGIDGWKIDMGADKLSDPISTSIGSISRQDFKQYYYADFYDYSTSVNQSVITFARPYSFQGGIGAPISKHSCGWCGDHDGDFNGIRRQKDDIYESAQLGYGAPGVEIGGYDDPMGDKNSLIRYAQFGAFAPIMENGGVERIQGEQRHLPWFFDEETVNIYRYFATLHSELVPYIFSYSVESNLTGLSILRDTDKTKSHHKLGEEFFVSVITSDVTSKTVDLPSIGKWIDYWNESNSYQGGTSFNYSVPLDKFSIFIKEGAIIPMNVKNSITNHGDNSSNGKITILVYPYGLSLFVFHRPLGDGVEYEDISITMNEEDGTLSVVGSTSLNYIFRVKSFNQPIYVSGADNWNYNVNEKQVLINKTGSNFSIKIAGILGYGEGDQSLPVKLQNFSADYKNQKVYLQWIAESEMDNAGFEVYRSESGEGNYDLLSSFKNNPVLAGYGNSSEKHEYLFFDESVKTGLTYWYKLADVNINGKRTFHGPISVTVPEVINQYKLYHCFPNPFNPRTKIRFDIPQEEGLQVNVKLVIVDNLGSIIKVLLDKQATAGNYEIEWDGTNMFGNDMASGIYYGVFSAPNYKRSIKLLLLR